MDSRMLRVRKSASTPAHAGVLASGALLGGSGGGRIQNIMTSARIRPGAAER